MELRMMYSLAIIRAVNGLVDPSQKVCMPIPS